MCICCWFEVIRVHLFLGWGGGQSIYAVTTVMLKDWEIVEQDSLWLKKLVRTLDFHASQLFKANQGKDARLTDCIHKIHTLGSQFHEAALLNCNEGAREGILDMADRLRNICFIQRLASDRIQTIVRSRNYQNFDEIAETALVEDSFIASRLDRLSVGRNFHSEVWEVRKTGACQ